MRLSKQPTRENRNENKKTIVSIFRRKFGCCSSGKGQWLFVKFDIFLIFMHCKPSFMFIILAIYQISVILAKDRKEKADIWDIIHANAKQPCGAKLLIKLGGWCYVIRLWCSVQNKHISRGKNVIGLAHECSQSNAS